MMVKKQVSYCIEGGGGIKPHVKLYILRLHALTSFEKHCGTMISR